MNKIELKYGCNPNQKPAHIYMENGLDLPLTILNGKPGYINFLDALNAWQLVKELKLATGITCATSFKHVSPTSAALGIKMSDKLKKACFVDDIKNLDDSPLALAYARARGTDRMSSYGDFIGLSDRCDEITAKLISREVSDGVIAPSYDEKALEILKKKKKGNYNIIQIDPNYDCVEEETKMVFGITFKQAHNKIQLNEEVLNNIVTSNTNLPLEAKRDLIVALITLKYTQSNSVVYAYDGQAIGVGAGQQSRIHCTRLAGSKADTWFLRMYDKVLNLPFKKDISRIDRDNIIDSYINKNEKDITADNIYSKYFEYKPEPLTDIEIRKYLDSITGVSLASDAFFPFSDNIERAYASGVSYIAQPGGSLRDQDVIDMCNKLNITMCFTGIRLFHH